MKTATQNPASPRPHPGRRLPAGLPWVAALLAAALLSGFPAGTSPAARGEEVPNTGLVVPLPAAITTEANQRLRSTLYGPLKRFESRRDREPDKVGVFKLVLDFNADGRPRSNDVFGACYELAKYLRSLQKEGVRTVAFIHGDVTGHAVLAALACDEIFLSTDPPARIGKVAGSRNGEPGRSLDGPEQLAYEEVARNRYPLVLVRKMYDKDVEVIRVKPSRKTGPLYRDGQEKPRPEGEPVAGLGPGDTALFSFAQAREFGLCRQVACNTLDDVLTECGLSRASLHQSLEQPVAWRVVVAGTINGEMREKIERRVKRALAHHANLLILQLECGDGDAQLAYELGMFLAGLNDRRDAPVETVAYVTNQARNTATFLAFGCNKIVMQREVKQGDTLGQAPARLGDFDGYIHNHPSLEATRQELERLRKRAAEGPERDIDKRRRQSLEAQYRQGVEALEEATRKNLVDLAARQHYPSVLAEGMLSRDLRIRLVTKAVGVGGRKFMSEEEFQADQQGPHLWRSLEVIKPAPGTDPEKYLTLSAERARELGVAQEVVANYDELCELEGVTPDDVHDARTDWLDTLADFLRDPWTSVILVMVGITCLILELKMPGVGLPGVVAAVCFVLFFWSHSQLNGQITWLALLLFVLGLLLIGLEVFVLPGLGVSGISGILLVLVSLGLVAYGHWPRSNEEWLGLGQKIGPFGISILGALGAAFVLARYLPSIPYANRLMLRPPDEGGEGGALNEETPDPARSELAALLGAIGVAATPLRPAGKVQFGDSFVDVVAEGSYVIPGTRVQVVEIEGNRVVVKEV